MLRAFRNQIGRPQGRKNARKRSSRLVGATSATERLSESGLNSARHLAIFGLERENWGVAKWLRRRVLIPVFPGSNPGAPANFHIAALAL